MTSRQRREYEKNAGWREWALCLYFPAHWWFAHDNKVGRPDQARAIAVCRECPVREPCLEYALVHNERWIWGGTTEKERKAMRAEIRKRRSA